MILSSFQNDLVNLRLQPPEIVALDLRQGIVPQGRPEQLAVSTLQI